MAGGKQSPRDKMIGMMYLVLTALLALQVSNAVLEKFIFINSTLEGLAHDNGEKNVKTLSSIENAYNEKGKRPEHLRVLNKSQEIRQMTTGVVEKMEAVKERMVEITGGRDENGKIIGAKDYDKVGTMMLFQPDGKEFEKTLDDYVDALNKIITENELGIDPLKQLSKDASEMPVFANDPDQKTKGFLEITFLNTPTAAGMASVSQLTSEVLEYEGQILTAMAKKVDAAIVDFNIIVPMVKPRSEVVASGATYEADLFIVASAEGIDPVMKVNGTEITVEKDPNGIMMGKVRIPARGEGEKSFKAEITMNDTTFTQDITYNVMTPTLQFNSASLSALYANCANPLDVQCPALGNEYNPTFTASNANTKKGPKLGLVEVIPTSRRSVTLSVASGGNAIGKQTFQVKSVPQPTVQILDRGNVRADNKDAIPASAATRMTVRVEAEENFAKEAPKDNRYRVREVQVLVAGNWKKFNSPIIDLAGLRLSGTVAVKITRLERIRHDGSSEQVILDSPTRAISIR